MTIVLDTQIWNMCNLLVYSNIVKRKNNGLAHVDSSAKDQRAVTAFLNTHSNGWP